MFFVVIIMFSYAHKKILTKIYELQEVSSMLLEKLVAAGIGNRPVVFVTHRFVLYCSHIYIVIHDEVALSTFTRQHIA